MSELTDQERLDALREFHPSKATYEMRGDMEVDQIVRARYQLARLIWGLGGEVVIDDPFPRDMPINLIVRIERVEDFKLKYTVTPE